MYERRIFSSSRDELSPGRALRFVIFLGILGLLADTTYEGGRSLIGPYLSILGAGSTLIGFASGASEFLGYAIRYPAGLLARRPRTRRLLLYAGYFVNLMALPLLTWIHQLVGVLLLLFAERAGRGLRNPAKKSLLADAGDRIGLGRAFGLHEALDTLGAIMGPLLVAVTLSWGIRAAFAMLFVPAILAYAVLFLTLRTYKELGFSDRRPSKQPPAMDSTSKLERPLPKHQDAVFLWLCVFGACLALGLAPMVLLGYEAMTRGAWSARLVALGFSWAMAVSALSAPVMGWCYDRYGYRALRLLVPLVPLGMIGLGFPRLTTFLLILTFTGWGLAMGALEGVLPAAVSRHAPSTAGRARLFGIFDLVYGTAWLAGGSMIGWIELHEPRAILVYVLATSVFAAYALHRQQRSLRATYGEGQ